MIHKVANVIARRLEFGTTSVTIPHTILWFTYLQIWNTTSLHTSYALPCIVSNIISHMLPWWRIYLMGHLLWFCIMENVNNLSQTCSDCWSENPLDFILVESILDCIWFPKFRSRLDYNKKQPLLWIS